MHGRISRIQRRFFISAIILVAILVTGFTLLLTKQRYDDFVAYHNTIAQTSVEDVAREIEQFVAEHNRLVRLFAEDHRELLLAIARDPENFDLQDQLTKRIKRRFPNYFAFTITDSKGRPRIEDFDGFVGDLCIADVQEFSRTSSNLVRIHPNNFAYHFDVMAPYGQGSADNGILLISFHAEVLSSLLQSGEVPGHEMVLSIARLNHLIEVTSTGTRIDLDRSDFSMTDDEKQSILVEQDIPGTRWQLINLYESGFRESYRRELIVTQGAVLGFVLLVLLMFGYAMFRLDARRVRAEKFKDDFLGVVSHELRTPITAIQGALSLFRHHFEISDDQQYELLNIAESNSRRLSILVDDLLELRTLDAGKLQLDCQPCGLNQLVQGSLEENQGYAEKCGVRFELGRTAEHDIVLADERRLKQVMANYLSNAAKFSPVGAVVTAHVDQIAPATVRVSVVDRGEGVPVEFQNQLFEKFSQADGTSSRMIAGTGLGLAIVKGFVEAHGGSVGFESSPGKGSVFFFELPLSNQ